MGKKKYKAKHVLVREYIPDEFQEVADSAYDHIGHIVETTPLDQLAGGILGAISMWRLTKDPETALIGFATGIFAVKGIGSGSEIVGSASLATLAGFGGAFVLPTLTDKIKDDIEKTRELGQRAFNLETTMSNKAVAVENKIKPEELANLRRLQKEVIRSAVGTAHDYSEAMRNYSEFVRDMEQKYGERP